MLINLMQSKLYKTKLLAVHDKLARNQAGEDNEDGKAIHAYFGMLKHVFQRNRHMIKELKLSGKRIQQCEVVKQKRSLGGENKKTAQASSFSKGSDKYLNYQLLMPFKKQGMNKHKHSSKGSYHELINRSLEQPRCFVPIGSASNNQANSKRKDQVQTQRNYENELPSISQNPPRKVVIRQLLFKVSKPKLNVRDVKNGLRIKTEGSEETYNSSIRTSQRSNCSRRQSCLQITGNQSQAVAPW